MKLQALALCSVCALIIALSACTNENENATDTAMTNELSAPNTTNNASSTPNNELTLQAKNEHEITATGSIFYKKMEGGFYAFITNKGKKYTLHGLNEAFQQNGLVVKITGEVKPDLMTVTQFGEVLQVKEVEVLDTSKVIKDTSEL